MKLQPFFDWLAAMPPRDTFVVDGSLRRAWAFLRSLRIVRVVPVKGTTIRTTTAPPPGFKPTPVTSFTAASAKFTSDPEATLDELEGKR